MFAWRALDPKVTAEVLVALVRRLSPGANLLSGCRTSRPTAVRTGLTGGGTAFPELFAMGGDVSDKKAPGIGAVVTEVQSEVPASWRKERA